MQEKGYTLIEIVATLALSAFLMMVATVVSVPILVRESAKSAAYDVQSQLRLTRSEAVKRNRDCRLVLDTVNRQLSVFDSLGTVATTDDVLLHSRRIASSVDFARPDPGPAVTLGDLGGNQYGTTFHSDGTVDVGGDVFVAAGGMFRKVSLHLAGGQKGTHWNGNAWIP